MWHRSGGVDPGRDGCRIPLPWSGAMPPYGFSPEGAAPPWLDQPDGWAPLTVAAQSGAESSMLSLYREGLRLRRSAPWAGNGGPGDAALRWLPSRPDVIAFERGDRFACLVNFGAEPVPLLQDADVLISSDELEGGALPRDTSVWLRQANDSE